MNVYDLEVKLSKQEDGLWRAEIPSLPGCFVDGPVIKDVMHDIQECAAMALDLELELGRLPDELKPHPQEHWRLRIPVVIEEHTFKRFPLKKATTERTPESSTGKRKTTA
jgi:predicted RNase H-like HicB family nuclease